MIWALYACALIAAGLLVAGATPPWLWTTLAILFLTGAMTLLARQAVRE